MSALSFLSRTSAILFVSTGLIIAFSDFFLVSKTPAPIVSATVSVIFILLGAFMFALGKSGASLAGCIDSGGMTQYRKHTILLNIFFMMTLVSGALILYGVISRIGQGFSVFG